MMPKNVRPQTARPKRPFLKDGAQRAKNIVKKYDAPFKSREEYFNYVDKLKKEGNRINYNSDGTASVDMF